MRVIGIDSHKDTLAGCLIDDQGRPLEHRTIANTPAGHHDLIDWATAADAGRVGVEGSGNYGRPATLALIAADIEVVEVPPQMTAHARHGQRTNTKNDDVDALLIARIALRDDDLPPPRPDGPVEELRLLVSYRRELVEARNQHVNRLHADLEQIRCGYHHKLTTPLTSLAALTKVSRLLSGDNNTRAVIAKRRVRHIRELTRQIGDLTKEITATVNASDTTLTKIHGVGALVAADIMAEVGDPTRFPTKAKFAMANGTAPLDASSGRGVRHRLNRGGNRQLNKAIHTAAITQISRPDTEGRRLYEAHLSRGKTKREAIRALKRRISDRVWTHLQTHPSLT